MHDTVSDLVPARVVIPEKADVDQMSELTANVRLKLVEELTKNGRVIPDDAKEVNTLLAVLDSIDKQANDKRKLNIEEKAVDVASRAAANAAEIIRMSKGNPFLAEKPVQGQVIEHEPDVPHVDMVPKQDFRGTDKLNYDDFVVETSIEPHE